MTRTVFWALPSKWWMNVKIFKYFIQYYFSHFLSSQNYSQFASWVSPLRMILVRRTEFQSILYFVINCNHLTGQTKYDYLSKSAVRPQGHDKEKLLINTSQLLIYFLLIAIWQFTFGYNDHFTFINCSWLCKDFVCFTWFSLDIMVILPCTYSMKI